MVQVGEAFKKRAYHLVAQVPKGRVMAGGRIFVSHGNVWSAREIGRVVHTEPSESLRQHVVTKSSGLATGCRAVLGAEGVEISEDYKVGIARAL